MPIPGQPQQDPEPDPQTATTATSEPNAQSTKSEDTTGIKDRLAKLESENSQLKNKLLDDDYIAFLDSRKRAAEPAKPQLAKAPVNFLGEELTQADIDKLTPSQILKLAQKNLGSSIVDEIRNEFSNALANQNQAIETIVAHLELQQVKADNPDFDSFKDDVAKILQESTTSMTIADALDKARINRSRTAPAKTAAPAKSPASTEKPGTHPPSPSLQKKEYKNESEAAAAALEEVKTKFGISGDTI